MSSRYGGLSALWRSNANETASATATAQSGATSLRLVSAARILFGAIFLFDGCLKWYLLQQGQLQGVVQGFGIDSLSANWLLVGVVVGIGETAAGAALLLGIFQRPAALSAAAIMGLIWAVGGYGGWGQPGYTDPGGDLMLALVFVVLAFAPTAYGVASRLGLRERWGSSSLTDRALRLLVA
ncbi:MAG: DoxX family membrane protein [Thermoplasmata archaeon]|nr:DoxX family membrane protein [Thermoplasmata archaeon]